MSNLIDDFEMISHRMRPSGCAIHPIRVQEYLARQGMIGDIYESMDKPDLAATVMRLLEMSKKIQQPLNIKPSKSEAESNKLRIKGNDALNDQLFQETLVFYNKAIACAPKDSKAMVLAYSNRSWLLIKMKCFEACINDIDKCFSIGCPPDIVDRLRRRRAEAQLPKLFIDRFKESCRVFSKEYFLFNVKRNPEIPCASSDIEMITDCATPKAVAGADIKIGVVLASETPYVSQSEPVKYYVSCYYCHKLSMNLQPCDTCCEAMFCSNECKQKCLEEYHDVECQIQSLFNGYEGGISTRLALKGALKMVHASKSWTELITASKCVGLDRMKDSSLNEIFDSSNKYCVLTHKSEKHFLYGKLFNYSFIAATAIHYLDQVKGFFPSDKEKRLAAMEALGRLIVFLSLHSPMSPMCSCASVMEEERTDFTPVDHYGYFPFIGKLKRECNANCIAVANNKKLVLIACRPIKRGSEITVSYVGHWLDFPTEPNFLRRDVRGTLMYVIYDIVCNCKICDTDKRTDKQLTQNQKKNFAKLNIEDLFENFDPFSIHKLYPKLCKTLAFLDDVQFSKEYVKVFTLFRKCILSMQIDVTENISL